MSKSQKRAIEIHREDTIQTGKDDSIVKPDFHMKSADMFESHFLTEVHQRVDLSSKNSEKDSSKPANLNLGPIQSMPRSIPTVSSSTTNLRVSEPPLKTKKLPVRKTKITVK